MAKPLQSDTEQMTEEAIEAAVERSTDFLDALLLDGMMTQDNYDEQMSKLADWADAQLANRHAHA